jgi:hypothetical protein
MKPNNLSRARNCPSAEPRPDGHNPPTTPRNRRQGAFYSSTPIGEARQRDTATRPGGTSPNPHQAAGAPFAAEWFDFVRGQK